MTSTVTRNERLLVGACGAIGILNLHEYLIAFRNLATRMNVVFTRNAGKLVSTQAIGAVTGSPIYSDDQPGELTVPHMQLGSWADLLVVVPASANIIGKAANGIADNLLSSIIVATSAPVVFVPSMNPKMWSNVAVQRNVARLKEDGHRFVTSDVERPSMLAGSGEWIMSELMPAPADVVEQIRRYISEIGTLPAAVPPRGVHETMR